MVVSNAVLPSCLKTPCSYHLMPGSENGYREATEANKAITEVGWL